MDFHYSIPPCGSTARLGVDTGQYDLFTGQDRREWIARSTVDAFLQRLLSVGQWESPKARSPFLGRRRQQQSFFWRCHPLDAIAGGVGLAQFLYKGTSPLLPERSEGKEGLANSDASLSLSPRLSRDETGQGDKGTSPLLLLWNKNRRGGQTSAAMAGRGGL